MCRSLGHLCTRSETALAKLVGGKSGKVQEKLNVVLSLAVKVLSVQQQFERLRGQLTTNSQGEIIINPKVHPTANSLS